MKKGPAVRLTVWMCLLCLVIACGPVLGPTVYMAAPALAEAEQWQSGTIAYCDEWVSLREAPSKESRRLVKIPLGEEVQVIVSSGEFFLCKYGNLTGYVMSRYIRLNPSSGNQVQSAETATVPAQDDALYVVPNVREYLTLRSQGGDVRVKPGERLKVLGWSEDKCLVEMVSNGKKGYVNSGYIMAEGLEYTRWPYDYDTLREDIEAFPSDAPVTVEALDQTADGRDILVIRYGDEDADHHILIQCAMHAREIMTSRIGGDLVRMMMEDYPQGIEQVCVHIVPLVNPDGMEVALRGPSALRNTELAAQVKRWLGGGDYSRWKANANGVDINRNFDAGWDKLTGRKAGGERYRGPAPHSEPESKSLVEYVNRYPFDCTISIHSYGSLIYWLGAKGEIYSRTESLARVISQSTGYPMVKSESGVEKGGFKDWALETAGIPSVTIEVGCRDSAGSLEECSGIVLRFRHLLSDVVSWVKKTV